MLIVLLKVFYKIYFVSFKKKILYLYLTLYNLANKYLIYEITWTLTALKTRTYKHMHKV